MKLLKWLAELRLFRFQCMYSTWAKNIWRLRGGIAFFVSLLSVIIGVCVWVAWLLLHFRHEILQFLTWLCSFEKCASYLSWVGLLGLVLSMVGIFESVKKFREHFLSSDDMICFKDRNDKCDIIDRWHNIAGNSGGFTVREISNNGQLADFYSYSKALNKSLTEGLVMRYNKKDFHKTECWKAIHKNLREALLRLDLKQRSNGYQCFTNESKVAIVSDSIFNVGSSVGASMGAKPVNVDIARTCYYATYLTNEAYRDFVFSAGDMANEVRVSEWMSPFGAMNDEKLLSFSAARSYHVGVNTLGITRDGVVCIWRQRRGQRSNNLMAPTGSGSMDWSDVKHARNKNFNDAIIYGAKRELKEESFGKNTRDKLVKLAEEGRKLESRIIGMYRWGSLGGLPGFVLVTMMPLKYDEIELPMLSGCGGAGECVRDSVRARVNILKVPRKNMRNCGDEFANEVDDYRKNNSSELSVPLYVCLDFLAEALRTNQDLVEWIYKRVEN